MTSSNLISFATLINKSLFIFLFLSILSFPQFSCIKPLHQSYPSSSSSSSSSSPSYFPQLPPGFLWGTATAAYQVEGAHNIDGRGPSIWDTFSNTPGKILDSSTGNDAVNHYDRLEEDLDILKSMQVNVYRFSISWSRIFPTGKGPTPNQKGVEFYDRLINGLKIRGIEPFITLFHWDLPQFLETNHDGWLGQTTVDEFVNYAEFCFNHFGDRVKYWLTFNEPHSFLVHGYSSGWHAPGRCSNRLICVTGNTSTEPYLAGHNVLRAHAYAVDIYRKKYQQTQKGKIGITVDIGHYEPYDPSNQLDIDAAERAAIWHGGWFADPVYFGDYPAVMKERVGDRLPTWSEEDRILIKGSSDFFGLNHYTTSYTIHVDEVDEDVQGYYRDRGCVTTSERDGKLIGPRGEPTWLFVVPRGMRGVLNWVSRRYGNPDIYITENGVSAPGENAMKIEDALEDQFRVDYYRDYIDEMSKAVKIDKVNVIGYMAWSLVDNFEWADGYEKRFGLFYVDFKNNCTRIPKKSAKWYAKLIEVNSS